MRTIKDESELDDVVDQVLDMVRNDIGKKAIVVALSGPLGAGKTALTKILMRKLGVFEPIVSPTYVLHIPYETIDHLDLYRLETEDEFNRLHIEDMLKEKHLVIIEWADKFEKQIKQFDNVVWVKIGYGDQPSERTVEINKL